MLCNNFRMDFAIAHFEDENSVAVIPSKWVKADGCYWPPYRGRRLDAAVRDLENPVDHCWTLLPRVRILHQYGTFIHHAVKINGLIFFAAV